MGADRVFDSLCNLAETRSQRDPLGGLCEATPGAERLSEIREVLLIE
jgi:hypothetical protein